MGDAPCNTVRGFAFNIHHPVIQSEILTLQLMQRPIVLLKNSVHVGVLATLNDGIKVLIHKVIVRIFVGFALSEKECTYRLTIFSFVFGSAL